ncbi:MAG TPA: gamma-glutamylcyclotransferase family protein [Lacunisphaera sp.]|nr:gamma-glutamylcyclotransferase family protein [Lacunisphaera sp.]
MTTVFVYGTLKRGGSNHLFLQDQRFLGEARTASGYTLYSLGDYPGMVRAPGDTIGVTGELWVVDDGCLAELDCLEGLDEGLYERVEVLLAPNHLADSAQTYLYLRPHHGLEPVGDTWPVGGNA